MAAAAAAETAGAPASCSPRGSRRVPSERTYAKPSDFRKSRCPTASAGSRRPALSRSSTAANAVLFVLGLRGAAPAPAASLERHVGMRAAREGAGGAQEAFNAWRR